MTTRQFVDSKGNTWEWDETPEVVAAVKKLHQTIAENKQTMPCLLYTSPSPRDVEESRMPSSA